jgi:DNA (cytosine-5)-methyltransferase 1
VLEEIWQFSADRLGLQGEYHRESSGFKLLELYSGCSGAGMGYWLAGFDVTAVDIRARIRNPFRFIQANALELLQDPVFMSQWDAVHASPPCQLHTQLKHMYLAQGQSHNDRDWLEETRYWLDEWGGLYLIENVPGAPMKISATMCGTQFGLEWGGKQLQRHRWFESNFKLSRPGCKHSGKAPWGIYGSLRASIPNGGDSPPTLDAARKLMGISWMLWPELKEAIPPAFTYHLGLQLRDKIRELSACTSTRVA